MGTRTCGRKVSFRIDTGGKVYSESDYVPLRYLWDLLEEIRALDLFYGSRPRDIVRE